MRLSKEMIRYIATGIVSSLESKKLARLTGAADAVAQKIEGFILADLAAEDKLDAEVEKILASHEAEIAQGRMDYRKLFELTKQKLAKERGMVL